MIAGGGAGIGSELLETGEGEEGKSSVEGGVGGDAGDSESGGCGVGEGDSKLIVASAGVAEAEIVEEMRREGMGFIKDKLLAEDVGEAGHVAGAED